MCTLVMMPLEHLKSKTGYILLMFVGMLIHSKAKPSKITCKLFQHRWQITRKRVLAAKLTSSKG